MQALSNLNVIAIVLVVVFSMLIGFIWYSLPVFGTMWMKEGGYKESDLKGGSSFGYLLTTIGSVVMAIVMSLVLDYAKIDSMRGGMKMGVLLWIGFVATSYAATYVFSKRSTKLYLIDAGYFLANLVMAGAVIAYFN